MNKIFPFFPSWCTLSSNKISIHQTEEEYRQILYLNDISFQVQKIYKCQRMHLIPEKVNRKGAW